MTSIELVLYLQNLVLDKKANDVVTLEMKKVFPAADYFLICSVESEPQGLAIASYIEEMLAEQNISPVGIEGTQNAKWILMDYDEVIVHIFYESTRRIYDLESLWNDAPRVHYV